jgi:hypothetical protein
MPILYRAASTSRPRWDGNCVLFEMTVDRRQVPCAISRAALEAIGQARCTESAALLERFSSARVRIQGLALEKLHSRAPGVTGRLSLWADDVDDPAPGGTSASGRLEAAWLRMA